MKLITSALVILMCSACTSYYKPADTAATAELEILSSHSRVVVQLFKNEQCESFENGTQLSYLEPGLGDPLEGTLKLIEANKQTIITFKKLSDGARRSGFLCTTSVSFLPETDEKYRVLFAIKRGHCKLRIYRKTFDDDEITYELDKSSRDLTKTCFKP